MKIKTKLLASLGIISLLPPIAAYFALIGNPGISFALRMNEYEAQQGIDALRLQSDLNAIGWAVDSSLNESNRMQLEPKEREDAGRRRRLANDALRSGMAAYEAHLLAIVRSEAQQAKESLAGVKAADSIDERESQLLKELSESLPSFKTNAEKFIQLSDGTSQTEGQFFHQVFEPQVRDDLAKPVRELARVTDQEAGEYRLNIEKALKDTYKQTILIVLLGVAVSIGLAAAVSRAVVRPIRKLRDATLQLGAGRMDTRIPIHSTDELGQLAGAFNEMADSLAKLMVEHGQSQDELSQAHERLKNSVGELELRNLEASTLSDMADLLHSCFTLEEASDVIAASARRLFHGFSGAVLVFSASRNVLEVITTWGPSGPAKRVFSPSDCWALRRGRLHHSSGDDGAVRCSHFDAESRLPSLCIPLMAHGETLGILCLATEPHLAGGLQAAAEAHTHAGASLSISKLNEQLAISVAEQAALSFANLRLREKLRHQSIRDPLTGLFNRRYLDESLEREVSNALRRRRGLGVVMFDVDRFKQFNDLFGHDAGDTVLRELGHYLAKFIRAGDLACRYGGEEFTLILPECSLEETLSMAEELRASFQQLSIKHRDIVLGKVTISLGVAALPDNGTTPAQLLAAADGALLRAKREGRDRVLIAEGTCDSSPPFLPSAALGALEISEALTSEGAG